MFVRPLALLVYLFFFRSFSVVSSVSGLIVIFSSSHRSCLFFRAWIDLLSTYAMSMRLRTDLPKRYWHNCGDSLFNFVVIVNHLYIIAPICRKFRDTPAKATLLSPYLKLALPNLKLIRSWRVTYSRRGYTCCLKVSLTLLLCIP